MDARIPVNPQGRDGRRFLLLFGLIVLIVVTVVASINLVAYRYMLREQNQSIVQLLAGWGRMYKPILIDEVNPEVAVYGASWARDAFDPATSGQLLGMKLFNHAVSGSTPYESRRFADASLDNPNLEAAIVNLDTFFRNEKRARTQYGFDESILEVDPDLQPQRWVGLKRLYSLTLTGWAVGANLELISTIRARDAGLPPERYLEAYERADHTDRSGTMERLRERIFPDPDAGDRVIEPSREKDSPVMDSTELEIMLDNFCRNRIDVYAYYTPSHVRQQSCDRDAGEQMAVLELLRRKARHCASRIHYYDFSYPNAITLEGVLSPVRVSNWYRPDGHPRPSIGDVMAARMFAREFPAGTPEAVKRDFGVDLLTHRNAEQWLLERAVRCEGDWGEGGYRAIKQALVPFSG